MNPALLATVVLIALAGTASGLCYGRSRQWANAALVLLAAAALALLVIGLRAPAGAARTVTISDGQLPPDADQAAAFELQGDGLSAAQWHDLPARPLRWQAATEAALRLEFPRQLALGRMFALTLHRSPASALAATAATVAPAWRLQLLDENKRLLAQADGAGGQATVHWLPPVAQALLLQARVLDAAGQVLAQGPVPLLVQEAAPLQVQARLGAPSFDAQALNALLVASGALVDWQVTLGKTVTRHETARAALHAPDLMVIDAAQFEHASPAARSALLAPVAAGVPLLVLATNAGDSALWAQQFQLPLRAQPAEPLRLLKLEGGLELPGTALAPATAAAGPWTAPDQRQPWLWQRRWQAGRIAWLGVSDWHRYAIDNPQALAAWWQALLDRLQLQHPVDLAWQLPDGMPVAGERTVVCARGVRAEMAVRLSGGSSGGLSGGLAAGLSTNEPEAEQVLHLQRRADTTDAACAALWPRRAGWHTLQAPAGSAAPARFYVFDVADWPLWQRALRQDASARYAARAPTAATPRSAPLPAWPAAALFTLAMLGLWWRERR